MDCRPLLTQLFGRTPTDLELRSVAHYLSGSLQASPGGMKTLQAAVEHAREIIGPETAEEAGYLPDNPVDDWREELPDVDDGPDTGYHRAGEEY